MWPFSRQSAASGVSYKTISVREVPKRLKRGAKLVDVRSPREFRTLHPRDAVNVPPRRIRQNAVGLDHGDEIMVICMTGRRSARVARDLSALGYRNVSNVHGGLDSWVKFHLPVVRKH